eukprot:3151171-Pleurochrysis_carterae.AAC.1
MCFGEAQPGIKCFGGLVGPMNAEGLQVIGFDYGDLQSFPEAELKAMKDSGLVLAMGSEEPGIAENKSG